MLVHQCGKHMAPLGAGGGESAGIRTWRVLYVQQWSLNLGGKDTPCMDVFPFWLFPLEDMLI